MMNAIQTDSWQAAVLHALPVVETHARIAFRGLPVTHREEAVQEALCAACANYNNLAQRGRLQIATPSTAATLAVRHVRNGRHVGGHQDAAQDALSPAAQRRHGVTVRPLSLGSRPDELRDLLIADRRIDIPSTVAFRLDFVHWLSTFTRRQQRIITMLANGHRPSVVADRVGLSAGRISQLRQHFERTWYRFQGELPGAVVA
jgi:hypothetical protein